MDRQAVANVPTILIVEDDPDIRAGLVLLLEDEGYMVVTATDGIDALNLAGSQHVDLVLLDLNLPRLDGIGFCRAYHERGGGAPVILVTATLMATAAAEACGAVGLIAKPFQILAVLETVGRHLAPGG